MLTTDQILVILKAHNYNCEIKPKQRTHIVITSSDHDRVRVLQGLVSIFSVIKGTTATYKKNASGSTVGATVVDRTTIFVKPDKRNPVHYEISEINTLNKTIQDLMKKNHSEYITIKYKNKSYNVTHVEKTPGTPKSDFHFIDVNNKECLWISHKAGSGAKAFQQWSGMSERVEREIYTHSESANFVKALYNLYPNKVMPNKTTIMRRIEDETLKKMAVYGSKYGIGVDEGRNNVCYVLQGHITLKSVGTNTNVYTVEAAHKYENGDKIIGDYEPVFMAIYKGDRSNLGIRGLRAGILPISSRSYNMEM